MHVVDALSEGSGTFTVGALKITPIPVKHGQLDILGWKFEENGRSAAYLTDVSSVPHESFSLLKKLDVLFLGALRERAHETHFNFDQALEVIARTTPAKAYLTHLCHDKAHAEVEDFIQEREYRDGVRYNTEPAWDGLCVKL